MTDSLRCAMIEERNRSGKRQKDVAELCGVEMHFITRIEVGHDKHSKREIFERLGKFYRSREFQDEVYG